jgi:hypothetical protein
MPQQELAPASDEARDVGVLLVHVGGKARFERRQIALGIERHEIVRGIALGDIREERGAEDRIDTAWGLRSADHPRDPVALAAAHQRHRGVLATLGLHSRIDTSYRFDLCLRKAIRRRAGFAFELARIPGACARIGQDAIGDAVLHVAGREHRLLDQRHVCRLQVAVRTRVERLNAKDGVRVDHRRIYGCAGNHAVVVVGIALDLGEALSATGRAPLPVTALRRAAVVPRRDRLADDGRFMRRAMTEIDDPFRVLLPGTFERERPVGRAGTRVPEIVLNRGVSAGQSGRRSLDRQIAGRAAAADAEDLPVPGSRHAIDGTDLRSGHR